MVPPPWISNRQIKQFQQSRERMLEADLIAALFPTPRPLILAAHIPQLVR
jgi:hypothetical protein